VTKNKVFMNKVKKQEEVKKEQKVKVGKEKNEIKNFEREAQMLEQMEAELLRKL
jgi:hypothetical protein